LSTKGSIKTKKAARRGGGGGNQTTTGRVLRKKVRERIAFGGGKDFYITRWADKKKGIVLLDPP